MAARHVEGDDIARRRALTIEERSPVVVEVLEGGLDLNTIPPDALDEPRRLDGGVDHIDPPLVEGGDHPIDAVHRGDRQDRGARP